MRNCSVALCFELIEHASDLPNGNQPAWRRQKDILSSLTCEPMVLMILSNSDVRSAWNAFHCRQHRKMTIAASGRPLWKPTSPAQEATHPYQSRTCHSLWS